MIPPVALNSLLESVAQFDEKVAGEDLAPQKTIEYYDAVGAKIFVLQDTEENSPFHQFTIDPNPTCAGRAVIIIPSYHVT